VKEKMLSWIDIFSGDEMISSNYKSTLKYEDVCLEVQGKDIVDVHKLNELKVSKKDLISIVKLYVKRIQLHLNRNG